MKKSIILSLVLLFSACATPHIEHTQDNLLQITMNDKVIIKGEGDPLYKNTIKLLNLTIQQRVFLMDDNSVLTFEDASAAVGYRYKYGIQKTVRIIFPEYNYELIDVKGNIHFFTLTTKTSTEYLILENINKKRIKMIYGLDRKLFDRLLSLLEEENSSSLSNYISTQAAKVLKDESLYVKSTWDMKSSILNNLVTQVGRRKI
ncbi:hypothetical protein JHD49_07490 [Sulfurimonas sp. SAG-AH-194-C21]|nr:hypothetical protein [Sulfurimonas sp. SAG-AH-194-C21]MDF1883774.1 hypothetical protein [Sulfurimonas sp. SAG-AH-194-C21]